MKTKASAFLITLIFILSSSFAFAGASNAFLKCKSINSRLAITLEGTLPHDFPEFELKFKSNNGEILMSSAKKEHIQVVEAFALGVFTIAVEPCAGFTPGTFRSSEDNFSLYAIPSSVKVRTSRNPPSTKGTFRAFLAGPNPNQGTDSRLEKILMVCNYNYSI